MWAAGVGLAWAAGVGLVWAWCGPHMLAWCGPGVGRMCGHQCDSGLVSSRSIADRLVSGVAKALKPDHPLFDWLINCVILNHL